MLTFHNPGTIDPLAITTLGVNVKEGAAPIGYFGTGLKYAIACILRWGGSITIYSEGDCHTFKTESRAVRGKAFEFIRMVSIFADGRGDEIHRLGFTTELGKNWKPWQVYRELYCNAKDEGGAVNTHTGPLPPNHRGVSIVVFCPELDAAHDDRRTFILETSPLAKFEGLEIHRISGLRAGIFFKNILVKNTDQPAYFNYNILEKVSLTEDRTLDAFYAFVGILNNAITSSNNEELLTEFLTIPQVCFEANTDLTYAVWEKPSPTFLSVVKRLHLSGRLTNRNAWTLYIKHCGEEDFLPYDPPIHESDELSHAITIATELGFRISDFPVKVVENLPNGALGLAAKSTIYISRRTFEEGMTCLISTLIEEHTHLATGYGDCTRELQDFFLRRLTSIGRNYVELRRSIAKEN